MGYATTAVQNGKLILKDKQWRNLSVSADIKPQQMSSSGAYTDQYAGIYLRYIDDSNYVMLGYSPNSSSSSYKGTIFILQKIAGALKTIDSTEVNKFGLETHKIAIEAKGGNFCVLLDGAVIMVAQADQTTATTIGTIALQSKNQATCFDNISVKGDKYYFYDDMDANQMARYNTYVTNTGVVVKTGGTNHGFVTDIATYGSAKALKLDRSAYYIFANPYESKTWGHTKFNIRLRTGNWSGIGIRSRQLASTDGACYTLLISNSTTLQFRRNADYNTVVQSATLSTALSGYEKISLETRDNADGSVTLTGYRNDVAVITFTDSASNVPPAVSTFYPKQATKGTGGDGYSITFTVDTKNYIDYINLENPDDMKATITADKATLVNGETVTGSFAVTNNMYNSKETRVIMALYDNNNILVNVKEKSVTTAAENTVIHTDNFTLPTNIIAGSHLKLFAWDSYDNLQPISLSVAIAK